jgi:acyl-CoA thioesterase-1
MTLRNLFKFGVLLISGVVFAGELPNANAGKKRVVILGDSITAGYGLDPTQAYPALLQAKIDAAALPYIVVNAGVSGDTTAGGLRRIDWALAKPGADVLVVALGGNDGLRGVAPAQTAENLAGIIDKALAKNPSTKILVAGMEMPENMGANFVSEFKAVFPKVAAAKNAVLIPYLLDGVGGDEKLNQPDRIHPTEAGQQIVAENVWKMLEGQLSR